MNPNKLITISLIAIVILFGLFVWMQSPAPQTRSQFVPMDWIEQRHTFHGIESSVCDDRGECWFLRDGEKCNL